MSQTLTGTLRDDEVIDSHTAYGESVELRRTIPSVSFLSGFPKLDEKLARFSGGELVLISGPTKHGKTLFCQTITRNMSAVDKWALWFTYEVPQHQFLEQFGESLPAFLLPRKLTSSHLPWILDRVREAKSKFDLSAAFIDNTQNIVNLTMNNLAQYMGEVFKTLKRIAMEENIVIFLLHHMSKLKLDDGEELGNHHLRDSSMAAQTADRVIFVWRDKDPIINPNRAYWKVTADRTYGVMNAIGFMEKRGNFLEEL